MAGDGNLNGVMGDVCWLGVPSVAVWIGPRAVGGGVEKFDEGDAPVGRESFDGVDIFCGDRCATSDRDVVGTELALGCFGEGLTGLGDCDWGD